MSDKVMIKQSTLVKPAVETPKRRLWLSRLDMVVRMPYSHTASLHVYSPTVDNNPTPFFDANILKESLSKVLVYFYPMAGRLTEDENGRVEVDCNEEGVLFIEAETTHYSLADFGDFKPTLELRKLFCPTCDYSKGLSSFPILMVQLTRFKCGGVSLGFVSHHHLTDGAGYMHLFNSWARLTRGLDLQLMPIHERMGYLSPRNPPHVKFQHLEFDSTPPSLLELEGTVTSSVFKITHDQLDALKQEATSTEVNYRLSTYKVLAGHIWRTACKARGLADDQEVRLYMPSNGRSRFKNPALPQGFCGNTVFFPVCVAKAGEVIRNPLSDTVGKIQETLDQMTNEEYLRSAIDYMETHPNFDALVRGPHTVRCPNLSINSWATLNVNEADFGWGKPWFVGHGGISDDGRSFILPSPKEDGGFSLSICLNIHHMALFEKYLYDF